MDHEMDTAVWSVRFRAISHATNEHWFLLGGIFGTILNYQSKRLLGPPFSPSETLGKPI